MKQIHHPHSLRALFLALCLALCLAVWLTPALSLGAESEETLDIFNAFQEQSSAASRAPKPLSQTAENITVISAADIRILNAHTLADVLVTIPGIQIDARGSLGNLSLTLIQSSSSTHVLIMLDGIPLNTLGDNFSDISLIPAQIIERIEIVKGAASSSWGQAMGGVINIISKAPERSRAISGSATASIGTHTSTDDRVELSGTTRNLGYYISGGYLGTGGITPNSNVSANGIYTKLTWDLADNGQIWSTFKYDRADRGVFWGGTIWDSKEDQSQRNISASLGMRKTLNGQLEFELFGRYATRYQDSVLSQISDGTITQSIRTRELADGASAKLIWHGLNNLLVLGGDFEHAAINANDALVKVDTLNRTVDRWGVFLNDTITLGPLTIIPSARFDRTITAGDHFSPSLGAVWNVSHSTLLRGYTGNGFSLPSLLFDRQSEKVWSSQIGLESTAVPYLWVKGTLFRNETRNIRTLRNLAFDPVSGAPRAETRIANGAEIEIRTSPVYSTSLAAGYTFTDSTHASNGSQVYADPRHTVQLAIRYDDKTYCGVVTGRHVYWNSVPGFGGQYHGLIWDLHLRATLLKRENSSLELFFSGHNLFNGKQYQDELAPNAGQWFDGGLRVSF